MDTSRREGVPYRMLGRANRDSAALLKERVRQSFENVNNYNYDGCSRRLHLTFIAVCCPYAIGGAARTQRLPPGLHRRRAA